MESRLPIIQKERGELLPIHRTNAFSQSERRGEGKKRDMQNTTKSEHTKALQTPGKLKCSEQKLECSDRVKRV